MMKKLPQRSLSNYFAEEVESRAKLIDYAKKIYLSAGSELEEHRREINCMDLILSKERYRYEEKQKEFGVRWATAAQKLADVEKSMFELSPHYSDLTIQRDRSLQLAVRQEALKAEKLKDINQMKREKIILTKIKEETITRLDTFKMVEEYLNGVVLASQGEFKNIRELLERATLLETTRNTLIERDEQVREHVRRRERQLDDIKVIKANEAISLNNLVYELQEQLDGSKFQCKGLEEDLSHFKSTAAQRTMDLGSVRMSIYNLYLRICYTLRRHPKIPASDTLKQIRDIHSYMKEISKLRTKVGYLLKKARQEAERESKEEDTRRRIEFEKQRHKDKTGIVKREDIRDIFKLKAEVKAESTQEKLNRFLIQKYNVESLNVHRGRRSSGTGDSKESGMEVKTSKTNVVEASQQQQGPQASQQPTVSIKSTPSKEKEARRKSMKS